MKNISILTALALVFAFSRVRADVFESVDQVIQAACGGVLKLDRVKDSEIYNQLYFNCELGTTVDAQGCQASCRNQFASAKCADANEKVKAAGCMVVNGKTKQICETVAEKKKCSRGMKRIYVCQGQQICAKSVK